MSTLDERELCIRYLAGRFTNGVLSMMIGKIALLSLLPDASRNWIRPLLIGNTLVGLLIARVLAKNIDIVVLCGRARA